MPDSRSVVSEVRPANGETSEIALYPRPRVLSDDVRPASGDTSATAVSYRWSVVSEVRPANGRRSEIALLDRSRYVSDVRSANGETSEIALSPRPRVLSDDVRSASGAKSEIAPRSKTSHCRLTAYSIPVRSRTPLVSKRHDRVAISPRLIGSPAVLSNATSTALRRAASGIVTGVSESSVSVASAFPATAMLAKAASSARTKRSLQRANLSIAIAHSPLRLGRRLATRWRFRFSVKTASAGPRAPRSLENLATPRGRPLPGA